MPLNATPGDPAADALITRVYFTDWCAARGYDISAYDPATKIDPAIRRGSMWMNITPRWKGVSVGGRAQPQSWPRDFVYDATGHYVDNTTIPTEIEMATAAVSYQELIEPNSMNPTVRINNRVKRKKIGPMEKEFFMQPTDPNSYRPMLTLVDNLISGMVEGIGSNPLVGEAFRV
jgi:hypothetical protein